MDGSLSGSWSELYVEPIKEIIDLVCETYAGHIGCRFVMGGSSGGSFAWQLMERYPDYFDGGIPIAASYIPDSKKLKTIVDNEVHLLIAHGKHDELVSYEEIVEPRRDELINLKNCICYFPKWVRNGDGGVASSFPCCCKWRRYES